jgi:hypothetical protein
MAATCCCVVIEQLPAITARRSPVAAVQVLLPVLINAPYKLIPEQVVLIASNIGGKQALETLIEG